VVGDWAAVTYGVDRATFDLDIVVDPDEGNAIALADALRELDAQRSLGAGVTEPLDLDSPGSLLAVPLHAVTSEGPLDVLTRVPGVDSFSQLRADAQRAVLGDGTEMVLASKPALERIKKAIAEQADPTPGDQDSCDLAELLSLPDPNLPPA
jgi:hypothetical protein